jgi:transposase
MKTLDARTLPPQAQEDLRRKAVAAVRAGKSKSEAARLFGVARQTIHTWINAYQARGAAGLKARRRGRKPGGQALDAKQAAVVRRRIRDRHPDQLKLPFYLWTREAVQELIAREFGVEVSVWTVGRYLRDWGFTPQKPARRAWEQNPQAVRRWLREEYPALRKQARAENGEIYWEDEMGLRSDQAAGRSYAPRGRTPTIRISGNRFGCNLISAISTRGRLYFSVFRGTFSTKVFLAFLRRLIKQVDRKVFLILDGHPVHRARAVTGWLERHADRIRVFPLPPYSPELNPDEYLNQDVKRNAGGGRRPRDAEEMASNVRGYLRSTQRRPALISNYFRAAPVRYAAEL